MDQKKIGQFLKGLRKEKALTQEQFAQVMGVSNRTVSRWETGSNMPDLDLLIIMADYYDVEIRELLDGERKSEKMDKELKETVLKVADYSNHERDKFTKRLNIMFWIGVISFILYLILGDMDLPQTGQADFFKGIPAGIALGMLIIGVIYTSKYAKKIRTFKRKWLGRDK